MALHNLTITVVDGGVSGDKWGSSPLKETEKKPNPKDSKLYKILNYNATLTNKARQAVSPTTFFAVQSGINLASQTAKQFINYYITDIGRRNGDSNYQAQVNRRIEQVTDPISIAGGALGGAAMGAAFGAPGAVIGAVIGAASSAINIGFKYAERERGYQQTMFQENNNQAYNLARANYTVTTGRVR